MFLYKTNFTLCISVLMMVGVHWRIQINTATLFRDWRGRHHNVPTRFPFHLFRAVCYDLFFYFFLLFPFCSRHLCSTVEKMYIYLNYKDSLNNIIIH